MEPVQGSWLAVIGAIAGSSVATAQPAAQPAAAPAVPLLVIGAPRTFDLARLTSALDTYVPNARLVVTAMAASVSGAPSGCHDAMAAARAAGSPVALWLRWSSDGAIVIERAGAAGCAASESSTVDVPPEQPAFVYRVVALKVASLVRELPAPAQPPPLTPAPPVPPPSARPEPTRLPSRAIDLGMSGIADTAAASRSYFASAGAWFGHPWALGGEVRISLAHDATGPGGDGSARAFGAFAGVRRALVERPAWSIDVALEVGAIGVHAAATRTNQASAMSADVWTPAAALAPRLRVAVVGPLWLTLGPTLEILARPVELDLGVSQLYDAGGLRLRGDLNAELAF